MVDVDTSFNTRGQEQLFSGERGFQNIEPRRRLPNRPLIGLTLAVLFFASCTGAAVYFSLGTDGAEPEDVVRSFFKSTSRQDYESAYGLLTTSWQNRSTVQAFEAEFRATEEFSNFVKLVGKTSRPSAGQGTTQYTGRMTYSDGSSADLSATLNYEPDGWKIAKIDVRPVTTPRP